LRRTRPTTFGRVTWKNLYFEKCDLTGSSFFGTTLADCVFHGCGFKDAYFYDCTVNNTAFQDCDLRDVAFCGIKTFANNKGASNFESVEFSNCDLRGSAHSCEAYR